MPRAIPVITFDPDGKPLVVNIEFPTLQVVSYTLTLFEAASNSTVFRETGNNVNPEDDRYPLPTPLAVNKGRLLQFDATFIDPGGKPNASCQADAVVKQGQTKIGILTVAGTKTGTSFSGTSFAKLVG